jgi:hypothetical protein
MLKYLILAINIYFIISGDPSGVRVALKEDLIEGFERKLLPMLLEKLGNLSIGDKSIDLDAGITTLHIFLTNINLHIFNLKPENIKISLGEPDKLNISAREISGDGHLTVRFKLGFVSETDEVQVKVTRLNIQAETTISMQESPQENGKFVPYAWISGVNIDLDFDFDIRGSLVAFIARIVKSTIKSYIYEQLNDKLRNLIIEESRILIPDFINQIPLYVPLGNTGLALDYSLLSAPKIKDGYLLLNSNGAIVNIKYPETKNSPFVVSTNLPEYNENGKSIQMFLSEYSIKTAVNSLFISNMFNVTIYSEDLPSDSPIHLDSTSLESLIPGTVNRYGKGKLLDINAKVSKRPDILIKDGKINGTLQAEVSIMVRLDNTTKEEALRFITDIAASGDAHVKKDGQIIAQVHYIKFSNSSIIQTKLEEANIKNIEFIFNFATQLGIPILNNKYLSNINVAIPSIEGITFEDSTVKIPNDYVEININPNFNPELLNSYWKRRNVFLAKQLEKKQKSLLFLGSSRE